MKTRHASRETTRRSERLKSPAAASLKLQIEALIQIKAHHDWLRSRGDPIATRGARAEWLDRSILLSASPADHRTDAVTKVEFLRNSLTSVVVRDALCDGQEDAVAMIVAGASEEAERWSLPEIDLQGWRTTEDGIEARLAAIEPTSGEANRYRSVGRLRTVGQAQDRVQAIELSLPELRRSGDQKAIAGALEALRSDMLLVAATSVRSIRELEAKQAILCRHAALCEPAWLVDAMVGAPLRLDYWSLELSPTEEARLRSQLPQER